MGMLADYLRVPPDADDILLIQALRDGQMQRIVKWLNRPIYPSLPLPADAPPGAIVFDAAISTALMMLVGEAYDNRGAPPADAELGMPGQVHDLLIGYRRFHEPETSEVTG